MFYSSTRSTAFDRRSRKRFTRRWKISNLIWCSLRKLLMTIIEKFDGGPVGVGTIAASISENRESIEDMIEPYLIQIGLLNRTQRGRMATAAAYKHFGLKPPVSLQLVAMAS